MTLKSIRSILIALLLYCGLSNQIEAAGTGLKGTYFSNKNFSGIEATRNDPTVDFTWTGAPGPAGIDADDFSVRWEGRVEAVYSEYYTFFVTADDGAKLWIDNQLICGRVNYSASNKQIKGRVLLSAGQRYNIRLEFMEGSGTAQVKLEWSSVSQSRQVIPTARLYNTSTNYERGSIRMEQWNFINGTAVNTLTSNVNYPNKPSERDSLLSFECLAQNIGDNYGTKVSGYIKPRLSGSYTFAVAAADNAELWLSTNTVISNKVRIVNVTSGTPLRSFTNESSPINLSADSKYYVELLHKEGTGGDHFSVAWKKPGSSTYEIIPGDELVPAGLTDARPAFDTYLDTLARGHPRILISQSLIERLKTTIVAGLDSKVTSWWSSVQNSANAILNEPVNVYTSGDLLDVSRSITSRIYVLATAYQVTGDAQYAERAWDELSAGTNFPNWDPDKFLNVSEMTHGFAIGYDWLYDYWTQARRDTIRAAIRNKGLNEGITHANDWYFQADSNNWNLVCTGGLTMGALAIGDDYSTDRSTVEIILHNCWTKVLPVMKHYTTDNGAWYEGATYWDYATRYNIRMLAALETALGSDFGLANIDGVDQVGNFPLYINGALGSSWNFAETSGGSASQGEQMFWLAKRFNKPEFAWLQRNKGGADPISLMWYDARGQDAGTWPRALDNWFSGATNVTDFGGQEVVTMRSAWENNKATFLGIKGGKSGAGAHQNLDAGTFFFEALGVRWAQEMGHDDYGLPGYFDSSSSGQRWTYYRMRAEGQNTLVIGNSASPDQQVGSVNPVITFGTFPSTDRGAAVVDMSNAYPSSSRVWRGAQLFNKRKYLLIQDEIVLPSPQSLWWFMHIGSDKKVVIQPNASEVILTKGSVRLWMKVISGGGTFQLRDAAPMDSSPNPSAQDQNLGQKKLGIRLNDVTNTTLAVIAVPLSIGQNPPRTMPAIVPLRDW